MLFLEGDNPKNDIIIYLNTPGGSVRAGLAIYDTMQYVKPAVQTWCVGQAYSMGAVLLAGGESGKRYALPHSSILIHQPLGGISGQASDINIHAQEILKTREQLDEILAHHTGQTTEKIRLDADRDYFMRPEAALEYGIIDQVAHPRSELDQEEITEPDN